MKEPGSIKNAQIRAEGSRLNWQVLLPVERFIYNETISGTLRKVRLQGPCQAAYQSTAK
jgi:hypothetical protein